MVLDDMDLDRLFPAPAAPILTFLELECLAHSLSSSSGCTLASDLEDGMNWQDLRSAIQDAHINIYQRVNGALLELPQYPTMNQDQKDRWLEIAFFEATEPMPALADASQASVLLFVVLPTFRAGIGADAAYTLKMKLRCIESGGDPNAIFHPVQQSDETEDNTEDRPKDAA